MTDIILNAIGSANPSTVTSVPLLSLSAVVGWFLDVEDEIDETNIPFTVLDRAPTGFTIFQGIFDRAHARLRVLRRVEAGQVDADLARKHGDHRLATYS